MLQRNPTAGVMAIDPGINGAYALFTPNGGLQSADDLPRFSSGLDTMSVAALFRDRPSLIMIEREASRPGQGVSSVFGFGFACGVISGCAACSGAPVHYVSPNIWKKHFKLIGKPKDASRELASRLYPEFRGLARVKDHNRAEAILIGRYALDTASRPPAVEFEEELVI